MWGALFRRHKGCMVKSGALSLVSLILNKAARWRPKSKEKKTTSVTIKFIHSCIHSFLASLRSQLWGGKDCYGH